MLLLEVLGREKFWANADTKLLIIWSLTSKCAWINLRILMCLIKLFMGNTVNKLYNQPIGIIIILLVLYIFKTSIVFLGCR
jgi:hypothetical protein